MGIGLIFPIVSPLFMQKTNGILSPEASLFMRDFLYGVTIASFTLIMFFAAPFLGDLSDHLGRKKVLIISLSGTALSYLVCGYGVIVHNVIWLILGRSVAGFAAGSQPIAQAAIADISTREDKAVNMGMLAFAACIGFVVGPMIGGYFANPKWFGYSTPFFIAALFAFLNAIGVVITFKETYHPPVGRKLQITKGFTLFISAFTHKIIAPLITVMLLAQTGFAAYFSFLSIFIVQRYHMSTVGVGHFITYFGVVMAINYMILVRLAVKYFSLEKIIVFCLILTVFGMLIMLFDNQWILWLDVIPLAIGNSLGYTAILTLLSNSVDENSQGWIMGASGAATAISWTIGGLLTSLGAIHVYLPFIFAAMLVAIALVVFRAYR